MCDIYIYFFLVTFSSFLIGNHVCHHPTPLSYLLATGFNYLFASLPLCAHSSVSLSRPFPHSSLCHLTQETDLSGPDSAELMGPNKEEGQGNKRMNSPPAPLKLAAPDLRRSQPLSKWPSPQNIFESPSLGFVNNNASLCPFSLQRAAPGYCPVLFAFLLFSPSHISENGPFNQPIGTIFIWVCHLFPAGCLTHSVYPQQTQPTPSQNGSCKYLFCWFWWLNGPENIGMAHLWYLTLHCSDTSQSLSEGERNFTSELW